MRTIDLTVLGHEGPQLRAYLACMRRGGVLPRRLVHMIGARHPGRGVILGRWMPRRFRLAYAERVQDLLLNHWPRQIERYRPLVTSMVDALQAVRSDAAEVVTEIQPHGFRYDRYAIDVRRELVDGLGDPRLAEVLSAEQGSWVLYTGGGLLPAALLETPGLRFVHVHPGRLPAVRGADGILWSMLVRGRPSMSAFIMAPGIDTGAVIDVGDYPAARFMLPSAACYDDATLYRSLFCVYDPVLRADFWVRRILSRYPDLEGMPAVPQDSTRGCTYHFMHPELRHRVLAGLFRRRRRLCRPRLWDADPRVGPEVIPVPGMTDKAS